MSGLDENRHGGYSLGKALRSEKTLTIKEIQAPIRHPNAKCMTIVASVWPDPPLPDSPTIPDPDDPSKEILLGYMAFHAEMSDRELKFHGTPREYAKLCREKRRLLRLMIEEHAESVGYTYVDESEPETSPA